MNTVTERNFGLLIAYVLPGFVVVWQLGTYSPVIRPWLETGDPGSPTVGGFLYVTLASIAAGLMVSALRWLVLDTIHHRTGVERPVWDFSRLPWKLRAFEEVVENHYRHYQFYGNMLVAIVLVTPVPRSFDGLLPVNPFLRAAILSILLGVFFVASRDTLRKYYARTSVLLRSSGWSKETRHGERMAPQERQRHVQGRRATQDPKERPISPGHEGQEHTGRAS